MLITKNAKTIYDKEVWVVVRRADAGVGRNYLSWKLVMIEFGTSSAFRSSGRLASFTRFSMPLSTSIYHHHTNVIHKSMKDESYYVRY